MVLLLIGIKCYYKYKFNKSIHQPKLETLESIRNFSNNIGGIILMPKDSVHQLFTKQFFDNGTIFVFDNNKKILTNNYSNYNGICYSSIESKLCSDGSINNKDNLLFGQSWVFDSLRKSVFFLNADSALLNESQFIRIHVPKGPFSIIEALKIATKTKLSDKDILQLIHKYTTENYIFLLFCQLFC